MLVRWRIPLRYYVAVVAGPPALFLLVLGWAHQRAFPWERSFTGFVLFSHALAVLFTFVYNSTGGSLLVVSLLHGGINASTNVLAVPSSGPVFCLLVLLTAVLAVVVVLVTGPGQLAERPRHQWPGRDIPANPATRLHGT
jgi:hypothetical protein